MACFKPVHGFIKLGGGFTTSAQYSHGIRMTVPCGRCIGCRIDHARGWAIRMMDESRFHEDLSFITLTYSQENLPPDHGLRLRDSQLFLKRLRKAHGKFRYFLCGEYGGETLRPHYHAIMFGYRPDDLRIHLPGDDHDTYTSASLEAIWGLGFVTVGEVTPETCAYVARYVTKKITGAPSEAHYERMHLSTGELVRVSPEFATMSRRPGIGRAHAESYRQQLIDHDHVIHKGHPVPKPKYYDKVLAETHEPVVLSQKEARKQRAKENRSESTPERLAVREECTRAKTRSTIRGN